MHKCKNRTGGNISHLEQIVSSFFPYSQKQLGFDKPVVIVFKSEPSNADVLLGKTAHYDPQNYEVYLYVDKRHPKDILRSLSHELVHHAQNCRGDFDRASDTSPGYAQRDPHLRKMEREAYTKGNLIFRDFEDLIKTGKITIDINFKDSGEPQMSLKEWKDNELNMLLMKKWGLLKEGRGYQSPKTPAEYESKYEKGEKPSWLDSPLDKWERDNPEAVRQHEKEFGLDKPTTRAERRKALGLDEEKDHEGSCDEAHAGKDHDEYMAGLRGQGGGPGDEHYQFDKKEREAELEETSKPAPGGPEARHTRRDNPDTYVGPAIVDPDEERPRGRAPGGPEARHVRRDNPDTYVGPAIVDPEEEPPAPGKRIRDPRHLMRTTTRVPAVSVKEGTPKKISVREATEITQRILKRIKEGR